MKFQIVLTVSVLASVHSTYSPTRVMVDVTNEFGTCILKLISTRTENTAFSPYGLLSVGLVLYEGASGPTAAELHNSLRLPWDTQLTRIGFRDLHRYLKSYFTNDGFLRGLVLSKPNVPLFRNYTLRLQFYGFDLKTTEGPPVASPRPSSPPATTFLPVSTFTPPTTKRSTTEMPGTTTSKPVDIPTTPMKEATAPPDEMMTTKVAIIEEETTVETSNTMTTLKTMMEGKEMNEDLPVATIAPLPDSGGDGMAAVEGDGVDMEVTVMKTTVSMTVTAAVNPTTPPEPLPELPQTTTTAPGVTLTTAPASNPTTPPAGPEPELPQEITTTAPAGLEPLPQETTSTAVAPPTTSPPPPVEVTTLLSAPGTMPPLLEETTPSSTQGTPQTAVEGTTLEHSQPRATTLSEMATPDQTPTTSPAPSTQDALEGTTSLPPAPGETDSMAMESQQVTRRGRALYSKGYASDYRDLVVPNWVPHYQDPRWSGGQPGPGESWFFTPTGGQRVPVIAYTAYLPFAYIPEIASLALQLPLDDPRYYMMILLPDERDGLEKLLYALQWCSIRGIANQLKTTPIYAVIPSFTIVKHINLVSALTKIGIVRIFDPERADLSAMAAEPGLHVRAIEQVVTVSLRKYFANHRWFDATPADIEQHFIANHPFVYFVLDRETQVTLMAGTILDPTARTH